MVIIKLIILSYFINFIKTSHDSFKNECGPYKGLDDTIIMPTKSDCFADTSSYNPLSCCYVEGEKDLLKRTSCVLIKDNSDDRIELIEELSQIATKLKVDCNSPKSFNSDCGSSSPNSEEDCSTGNSGNDKCCFIKITSPQFSGKACKLFHSIDINTIGEAVVAAKTVKAELDVKCNCFLLKLNYYILLLFLFCKL